MRKKFIGNHSRRKPTLIKTEDLSPEFKKLLGIKRKKMNIEKDMKEIKKILEESMKERGKLLNILDSDKVPKIQIPMREQELKRKNEALQSALKCMEVVKGLPSKEKIIKSIATNEIFSCISGICQGKAGYNEDKLFNLIAKALHQRIKGEK